MELTIKTLMGLEEVVAAELTELGATSIETGLRVVTCTGDQELLYKANLHLRTALRILVPAAKFMAYDEKSLYRMLGKTDWSQYLSPEGFLWVDVVSQSPRFKNTQYLARLTKDAIVDQFRAASGQRPSVRKEQPDLRLNLHIGKKGHTTVSLDSSGEGLHRRGYRKHGGGAPLNEVLAAGLLGLAGYRGQRPLLDPMCGSGTILCEAAMIAAKQAPGLHRSFGFMQWPDFDKETWATLLNEARSAQQTPTAPLIGSDQDQTAINITRQALEFLDLAGFVTLKRSHFQQFNPPPPPTAGAILMTNPPYELRMKTGNIEQLYKEIGDTLKQKYTGYTAWLFSANRDALKRVGLRTSRKVPLKNGPLEARLQRYDLY